MLRSLLLPMLLLALARPAEASDALVALLRGPLNKEVIKDVIHEHHREVRQCAEARPFSRRSVGGKVVVHFLIGASGGVSDVRVASSTLSEPPLAECLTAAVRSWVFPKPKHGPVEINFPFQVGASSPSAPGPARKAAILPHPDDQPPSEAEDGVLK